MRGGLKEKLFEAIKGAYPNMFSLDRVETLTKEMGQKLPTAERRLRELCEGENPPIRPITNGKEHIMGYIYQETRRPVVPPASTDALDDQIRIIMAAKTVSWENYPALQELRAALKSNNDFLKRSVITKYGFKY